MTLKEKMINIKNQSIISLLKEFVISTRRLASISRTMDSDWPQSPDLRYKFVEYAGLTVKQGDTPLVFRAMDYGFSAYEKTLGCKPDNGRIDAFTEATARYLAEQLCTYRVYRGSDLIWHPADGKSLARVLDHRKRETSVSVKRVKADPETLETTYQHILAYVRPLQPNKLREALCQKSL